MFTKNLYRMLCALLVASFLAGCGSAPTVEPIQPTATVVPQAAATEVVIQPSATPVAMDFVASQVAEIAGMWTSCCFQGNKLFFLYNLDGTIEVGQQNDLDAIKNGDNALYKFNFDGNVFHIQDVEGPNSVCGEAEGTYRLTVLQLDGENSELKFEVIDEPCTDRRSQFGKITYWVNP